MESVMTRELVKQELIIYVYDYHFLDKENVLIILINLLL